MTTYFTDFSEYTTGVQPSDWTRRYVANFSWTVEADAAATGGKVLHLQEESANDRNALTWDEIDSDVDRADVEIVSKVRFETLTNAELLLAARGSGAAGSENIYRHGPRPLDDREALELALYVDGVFSRSTAGDGVITYVIDTWYWVRVRVNGTTHQAKVWPDGDPEPAAWDVETTDSTISGTGWVGLLRFRPKAADIDVFGVGTGGDAAPTEPVGITGPFLRTTGGYLRTPNGILRPA